MNINELKPGEYFYCDNKLYRLIDDPSEKDYVKAIDEDIAKIVEFPIYPINTEVIKVTIVKYQVV